VKWGEEEKGERKERGRGSVGGGWTGDPRVPRKKRTIT